MAFHGRVYAIFSAEQLQKHHEAPHAAVQDDVVGDRLRRLGRTASNQASWDGPTTDHFCFLYSLTSGLLPRATTMYV
jgi:hypothetical protein